MASDADCAAATISSAAARRSAMPLLLGLSAFVLTKGRGAAAVDPTTTRRSIHAHVEG